MSDSSIAAHSARRSSPVQGNRKLTFAEKADQVLRIGLPTAFILLLIGYPLWNFAHEFMPRLPSLVGPLFLFTWVIASMLVGYFYGPIESWKARAVFLALVFCGMLMTIFSGPVNGVSAVRGNLETIEKARVEIERLSANRSTETNRRAAQREVLEAQAAALRGNLVLTENKREIGRIRIAVYQYAIAVALLDLQRNVPEEDKRGLRNHLRRLFDSAARFGRTHK